MKMGFRFLNAEERVIAPVFGQHLAQLQGLERQEHQIG
jgi:hypothetical protein